MNFVESTGSCLFDIDADKDEAECCRWQVPIVHYQSCSWYEH